MESISTALQVNTTLEAFDMRYNEGITDRGLLTGEERFSRRTKVLRLYGLGRVTIGGGKLFVLCLKENRHLTSLTVRLILLGFLLRVLLGRGAHSRTGSSAGLQLLCF